MKPHGILRTHLLGSGLLLLAACSLEQPAGTDSSVQNSKGIVSRSVPSTGPRADPESRPGTRLLDANDIDVRGLAGTTQPVRWYYIMDQNTQRWYIVWPASGAVLLLDRVDQATSFGIYWKPVSAAAVPPNQG